MILLGYDIGSSSVKASMVEAESGQCIASAFYPKQEAPIISHQAGWAEQNPDDWWEYLRQATAEALSTLNANRSGTASEIAAIGISYQMHGLVCVDRDCKVLRPAIIRCDSVAEREGSRHFQNS